MDYQRYFSPSIIFLQFIGLLFINRFISHKYHKYILLNTVLWCVMIIRKIISLYRHINASSHQPVVTYASLITIPRLLSTLIDGCIDVPSRALLVDSTISPFNANISMLKSATLFPRLSTIRKRLPSCSRM